MRSAFVKLTKHLKSTLRAKKNYFSNTCYSQMATYSAWGQHSCIISPSHYFMLQVFAFIGICFQNCCVLFEWCFDTQICIFCIFFRRNMVQRAKEKLQMELLPSPAVIQSRGLMQTSMLDCQTVHLGFVGLVKFFTLFLLISFLRIEEKGYGYLLDMR